MPPCFPSTSLCLARTAQRWSIQLKLTGGGREGRPGWPWWPCQRLRRRDGCTCRRSCTRRNCTRRCWWLRRCSRCCLLGHQSAFWGGRQLFGQGRGGGEQGGCSRYCWAKRRRGGGGGYGCLQRGRRGVYGAGGLHAGGEHARGLHAGDEHAGAKPARSLHHWYRVGGSDGGKDTRCGHHG